MKTTAASTLTALPVGVLPVPAWVTRMGHPGRDLVNLTFYVWIVRCGSKIGLIDLGLPLEQNELAALDNANSTIDARSIFQDVVLLPEALEAEGLSGSNIDFVCLTQLVTYHTGGLDAILLPNATVFLPMAGLRDMLVTRPGHPPTGEYFTRVGWAALRQLAIEERLVVVEGSVEILPGVHYEVTGGHHPGSCAVKIQTDQGTLGILESTFTDENIRLGIPIGIAEDAGQCRAVTRRYVTECDVVVGIHDAANSNRFPRIPKDNRRSRDARSSAG